MRYTIVLLVVITIIHVKCVYSSTGDSSTYYWKCLERCLADNCTRGGGLDYKPEYRARQPIYNYLMNWSCKDECKYECMWTTVDIFQRNQWPVPQFHGKWPFIRVLGVQEPASTLFSLFNLLAHVKMIMQFTKQVRPDSPLYKLWWAYFIVSFHTWLWSTIFHCRDTDFTEFMDYACAFAMVLMNCYCMTIRILRGVLPGLGLVVITALFAAFYINYVTYLQGNFDYGYNMEVNIVVGTVTAMAWFIWCAWNRSKQPYVYKCALFVALSGLVMVLEIMDIPPIFWIFDSHSLWHLSTAPLVFLFYSFIIDDCRYLRKQEIELIGDNVSPKTKNL